MKEDYFSYYILSYFNTEKEKRLSQILHVLRGKRTPSMFYVTEINQWHHGFSIEKRIEREYLKNILKELLRNKLLMEKEKGYLLTNKGVEVMKVYFKNHYFPVKTISFSNLNLLHPFWERMQLFTQVFSEYSYQNTKYLPVIKDPSHQENVRQLFRVADGNIEVLFKQWVKEQELLFENMEEKKIDVFVNFLSGHNRVGKTRVQIAKELEMQDDEFQFYLRDILEELIELIKEMRMELPLVYKILVQTNEEVFLSLSQSTYQSYQLLKEGANIHQIAQKRRIKENTVKEHILEMAFIMDQFPVQHFVPAQTYNYLHRQFDRQKEYNFKKALADDEALEFYQYRLVELERMRLT